MFTAQGPSVLHAIEVAVVQFAQVHLVIIIILYPNDKDTMRTVHISMTPWVTPHSIGLGSIIATNKYLNQGV